MRNRLFLVILFGVGLLISLRSIAAPTIQHWQTANGARVYYIQAPQLPMVDVEVVFDAGSARDGKHKGLAQFTNQMLDKGAGDWDEETLLHRFDALGAQYSSDSLRDMATVSLRSLSEPKLLQPALATFAAIISRPHFEAGAMERERQQMLIGLKAEEDDPGSIAQRAWYKAVYGKHPYANPPSGTAKTIRKIKAKQILAFYHRYYVAKNAVIAIVGDVDRKQAAAMAEQISGGLPAGAAAPALPTPKPITKARDINIKFDSQQSHVLLGGLGMTRSDPDYMALYVGNQILGGSGFGSRIMTEVREKRGLSYNPFSYFIPMHQQGPFMMGLQTRNEKLQLAESVMRDTLQRFVAEGPTEAELKAAKQNLTGGFPLRIDSNRDKLAYLAMIGFYKLPLDYLETFNARVKAVTVAQIRDAFSRRVDPEHLVKVVVGGGA